MGIRLGRHIQVALPEIRYVRVSATYGDIVVAYVGSAGASPSQSMQSVVSCSMSLPIFDDCAQWSNRLSILVL